MADPEKALNVVGQGTNKPKEELSLIANDSDI
jgi:hypothetical protein